MSTKFGRRTRIDNRVYPKSMSGPVGIQNKVLCSYCGKYHKVGSVIEQKHMENLTNTRRGRRLHRRRYALIQSLKDFHEYYEAPDGYVNPGAVRVLSQHYTEKDTLGRMLGWGDIRKVMGDLENEGVVKSEPGVWDGHLNKYIPMESEQRKRNYPKNRWVTLYTVDWGRLSGLKEYKGETPKWKVPETNSK